MTGRNAGITGAMALNVAVVCGAAQAQKTGRRRWTLDHRGGDRHRREAESEMTVPLAIIAFDSLKVQKLKIENVNDFALLTPGLEVSIHAHNNRFTIGGVGTTFSSARQSGSAVAVYQSGLAALATPRKSCARNRWRRSPVNQRATWSTLPSCGVSPSRQRQRRHTRRRRTGWPPVQNFARPRRLRGIPPANESVSNATPPPKKSRPAWRKG